jgi:hypothetical protein
VSRLPRLLALVAATLSLSVTAADSLRAQALDSTIVGVRVRATVEPPTIRTVIGTLVRVESAGLHVAADGGGQPVFVPFDALMRLERSVGTRSAGQAFGRGAKIGFFVGAGVGLVATSIALAADLRGSSTAYMIPASVVIGVYSVALTVTTTLAGGALGMTARERWQRVPLSR